MENHHYYGNTCTISRNNINNNSSSNSDVAAAIVDGTNLNISNLDLFSGPNMGGIPQSGSMDNILEDLLQHTHPYIDTNTCDLSKDCSQTHNYFHLQSDIPSPNDEKSSQDDDTAPVEERKGKKRGRRVRGNNKEAVRRYREKLKARETSLEDEVKKLKASNQQLLKRLEGEGALQVEVMRLKCFLVDIKGKLEGGITSSSFRNSRPSTTSLYGNGNCGVEGKNGKPSSMLCGQVPNVGESSKFNRI